MIGPTKKLVSEFIPKSTAADDNITRGDVSYQLPLGDELIALNKHIGNRVSLRFTDTIECMGCQKVIKKSYSQGYCFPCSQRLARCDLCIVRPETCHYHLGTCREPEWGLAQCFQSHVVYLSNASGLKVGITRKSQLPTRWIDQGAKQAIPLFQVPNRRIAGLVEHELKAHLSDKTNWRKMLKDDVELLDMAAERKRVQTLIDKEKSLLEERESVVIDTLNEPECRIYYPVNEYPQKVVSINLDKKPNIESELLGIKGQYLIFTDGVVNLRKYSGYSLAWQA